MFQNKITKTILTAFTIASLFGLSTSPALAHYVNYTIETNCQKAWASLTPIPAEGFAWAGINGVNGKYLEVPWGNETSIDFTFMVGWLDGHEWGPVTATAYKPDSCEEEEEWSLSHECSQLTINVPDNQGFEVDVDYHQDPSTWVDYQTFNGGPGSGSYNFDLSALADSTLVRVIVTSDGRQVLVDEFYISSCITPTPTVTPTPTPFDEFDSRCTGLEANPSRGTSPLFVKFAAAGYDPESGIKEYHFDFGDNSDNQPQRVFNVHPEATHVYNNEGTFTATVQVKDSRGNWKGGNSECKIEIDTRGEPEVVGQVLGASTLPQTGAPLGVALMPFLALLGKGIITRIKSY